jgi:hypothetical protein
VDAGCSLTTAPLSWRSQGVGLRRVTWLVGGEAWPGAAVVGGAVGGGAERCAQLVAVDEKQLVSTNAAELCLPLRSPGC